MSGKFFKCKLAWKSPEESKIRLAESYGSLEESSNFERALKSHEMVLKLSEYESRYVLNTFKEVSHRSETILQLSYIANQKKVLKNLDESPT